MYVDISKLTFFFFHFPPFVLNATKSSKTVRVFKVEHTTKGKSQDVASLLVFQRPFASEMNVTGTVRDPSEIMPRKYSLALILH